MAEYKEEAESVVENLMEKIKEKLPGHGGDSSSSNSDDEGKSSAASAMKAKVYRLLGREKPVHAVLGGGKPADLFLWRNKKVSGAVLVGATSIWILFEVMEYHLLTLFSHMLILSLSVLFLWSNASTFINKAPPRIPEVSIPENVVVDIARSLRYDINRGFAALREIASGKDLKKFILIIAGLWVLSVVGNCFNFLTLSYIVFLVLYTGPVLYEKYEDKIDPFVEKAEVKIKKQYDLLNAKYLSKIPRGPLKDKKC